MSNKKEIDEKEVVEYRKNQALSIIAQYKDLMDKYDKVFEIDILEEELSKAQDADDEKAKKDTEAKYLQMLDKRADALSKKEVILEKIFNLEKYLTENEEGAVDEKVKSLTQHPSKRHSRSN